MYRIRHHEVLREEAKRVFVNGVERNFFQRCLFLIYVNDIVKANKYFSITLFADDASLTATGKDLDVLLCPE